MQVGSYESLGSEVLKFEKKCNRNLFLNSEKDDRGACWLEIEFAFRESIAEQRARHGGGQQVPHQGRITKPIHKSCFSASQNPENFLNAPPRRPCGDDGRRRSPLRGSSPRRKRREVAARRPQSDLPLCGKSRSRDRKRERKGEKRREERRKEEKERAGTAIPANLFICANLFIANLFIDGGGGCAAAALRLELFCNFLDVGGSGSRPDSRRVEPVPFPYGLPGALGATGLPL